MRDLSRDRVAPSGPSPMFARALARAREIEARRDERRVALEAERRAAIEAERQAAYLAERLAADEEQP